MREKIKKILQKIFVPMEKIKKLNTPKNRATLISIVIFAVIFTGVTPLIKDKIAKRKSTPLGAINQDAIMAVPRPPEGSSFLVLSSEMRDLKSVSSDMYDIFPSIPIDSTSFYFKEVSDRMEWEAAVFSVEWDVADKNMRDKIISIQRDGDENIEGLFGEKPLDLKKGKDIDGIQIYILKYPVIGEFMFSAYGNCLILGKDRKSLINSILAIKYATTRLTWDEGVCQASRTFIDGERRYLFFIRTDQPGEIRELPRRHVQSLSIDRLKEMAIARTDPHGNTRSILQWLTKERGRKDEGSNTYASDAFDVFMAYFSGNR